MSSHFLKKRPSIDASAEEAGHVMRSKERI